MENFVLIFFILLKENRIGVSLSGDEIFKIIEKNHLP
jgi:hypothetical protein